MKTFLRKKVFILFETVVTNLSQRRIPDTRSLDGGLDLPPLEYGPGSLTSSQTGIWKGNNGNLQWSNLGTRSEPGGQGGRTQ